MPKTPTFLAVTVLRRKLGSLQQACTKARSASLLNKAESYQSVAERALETIEQSVHVIELLERSISIRSEELAES